MNVETVILETKFTKFLWLPVLTGTHRKPPVATSGPPVETLGLPIEFLPVTTSETPVDTGGKFFFKNSKTDFESLNHALEHACQ